MAYTGSPDGHPRPERSDERRTDDSSTTAGGLSFTEAIDRRTGCIRASGRLDARAADMVSGTVDALRARGWACIVLDQGGVQAADDAGLHAVRSPEAEVAAAGGRMTLLNWPGGRTD